MIIEYYLLIKLFRLAGKPVDREFIESNVCIALYGDDNLVVISNNCFPALWGSKEVGDFINAIYTEFGMSAKPSQFAFAEDTLVGLEFLGSQIVKIGDQYFPQPRLGKLATSLVNNLEEDMDLNNLVQKINAIFYLTAHLVDNADAQLISQTCKSLAKFMLAREAYRRFLSPLSRETLGALAHVSGEDVQAFWL